ncbi:hypothetical protein GCM10027446_09070 [Angustibacter peucedani]
MSTPVQVLQDRYAKRRRLPGWAKVVIVLAVVLVLAFLAVVGLFVWAMSGGWDGLRPGASADSRKVVKARQSAGGQLDVLAAGTVQLVGAGEPVARLRYDHCYEGQNNWKVHDGYTLRCELVELVVVQAPGGDVTATAAHLARTVTAAGWTSYGVADDMTSPPDPDRSYQQQTRSAHYQREGERHQLDLVVTSRGDTPFLATNPLVSDHVVSGDPDALQAALAADGLKVVATTSLRYFDDS